MLNAGVLTFQEFAMEEPLPLATIQDAVLRFLRDRNDATLFGAQAVNAWVDEPRMTQAIDLLSDRAAGLAEDILARHCPAAARLPGSKGPPWCCDPISDGFQRLASLN